MQKMISIRDFLIGSSNVISYFSPWLISGFPKALNSVELEQAITAITILLQHQNLDPVKIK